METVEHIVKVGLGMFALTLVITIVGGWVLSLLEPWDKTELPEGDRPIDLIGRNLK